MNDVLPKLFTKEGLLDMLEVSCLSHSFEFCWIYIYIKWPWCFRNILCSKTTLHATCSSCNYMHDPFYDPVSVAASYPDRCLNRLPGIDGLSICGTPLLEDCNGQSHPLKPYLTTCFCEYLVKLRRLNRLLIQPVIMPYPCSVKAAKVL